MKPFIIILVVCGVICTQALTLPDLLAVPTSLASRCADQNNTCCRNVTCSQITQSCPSPATCTSCVNAYNLCLSNNGTNCTCLNQAFACLTSLPHCYQDFNTYADVCQMLNSTGELGECDTCPDLLNAPTSWRSCNSSLFCNATSTCVLKHSSGACDGAHTQIGECGAGSASLGRTYNCQDVNNPGTFLCTPVAGGQLPKDLCSLGTYGSMECPGNTLCTGGACTGFVEGDGCTSTNECGFGLYCSVANQTCVAQSPLGGICYSANECIGGTICFNGSCILQFSRPVGTPCTPGSIGECIFGSFCPNIINANCTAAPGNTVSCTSDTDCEPYGTTCTCTLSGEQKCGWNPYIPATCSNNYRNAMNCLNNFQCKGLEDDPSSCAMKNCPQAVQCALNCIYQSLNAQLKPFTCSGFPSYYCATAPTNMDTLLTGSPLPTSPRDHVSDGVVPSVAAWLLSILAVVLIDL